MSALKTLDALILKGGGVKGLAFAGAIRELEHHFRFQAFVGTSAGAVAAALLAAGASGADLEAELRNKSFHDFLDGRTWAALLTIPLFGGIHPGFALTNWIRDELYRLLNKYNEVYMKDLPTRAVIYAAQANRGPITFDTDGEHKDWAVHAAVRCSLSIPYFFRPQIVDQAWVYDGGLLNNLPVEIFLEQERRRIPNKQTNFLALYLGTAKPPPLNLGLQTPALMSLLIERNDHDVIERYHEKTIVIDTEPIGTIDFNLTDEEKEFLVLVGRASALEFLASRGLADVVLNARVRAQAEQLRAGIIQKRRRRRGLLFLLRYPAKAFAGLAVFFAILAALLATVVGPLAPPLDPLSSLEHLAIYLRR